MPTEQTALLHRLVGGDPRAAAEVLAVARTTGSASVLVAAAMLTRDAGHLTHAVELALGPRERQLVVIAEAHLEGNTSRLDALVRDHLADHPDHLLAAWIAGQPVPCTEQKEKSVSQLRTPPLSTLRPPRARTVARWLVSFVGFPLGGLAAMVVTGPVDTTLAAITGGLLTGIVLGAGQALAMRFSRRDLLTWVLATAAGLGTGLAVGASVVDFRTGLGDLVVQGAISGLAVGLAQALALVRRTGPIAFGWAAYVGATWSIGWAVTTAVGVQVDEQFTVFGAAGAITVTLLTTVLPVLLDTRFPAEKSS